MRIEDGDRGLEEEKIKKIKRNKRSRDEKENAWCRCICALHCDCTIDQLSSMLPLV